jgi:hypothetical protein
MMSISGDRRRPRAAMPALLIATALFLTTVPSASADPLTCISSTPPEGSPAFHCQTASQTYSPGTDVSRLYSYDGGAFTNELVFDEVLGDGFELFLTAFFVDPDDPGDFLDRIPDGFAPEVFSTSFGPSWIFFYVEDLQDLSCAPSCDEPTLGVDYGPNNDPPGSLEGVGAWGMRMLWFGDGEYVAPQVLHDADGGSDVFDDIITVDGSFDPEPTPDVIPISPLKFDNDPVITGSADDFRSVIVVSTVPEPATLWLLGMGAAAGIARFRWRRSRQRD